MTTHLLGVLERADVVRHGDQGLVPAVGDVHPPPLLLLLGEIQAVDGVGHLGLGLQQSPLPPLDALLQRLPLLGGERRGTLGPCCLLADPAESRRPCPTSSSSPAISSTSVSLCLSLSSSLSLGESLLFSPSSDSLPLSDASSSSSFAAAAAAATSCDVTKNQRVGHHRSQRTEIPQQRRLAHFLPRCRWPVWVWPMWAWPSSWLIFSSWTWPSSLTLYSCSATLWFWLYWPLLALG